MFFKEHQNQGNSIGMGQTFMEAYGKIKYIEDTYAKAQQAKSKQRKADPTCSNGSGKRSQAGQESDYWKFIMAVTAPSTPFKTFQEYDYCKRSLHKMEALGIWEDYCTSMSQNARFRDAVHRRVFQANDTILKELGSVPEWKRLLLPVMESVVPKNDGAPSSSRSPQTFRRWCGP